MDSDDEQILLSPLKPSPQINRRLKRLKKFSSQKSPKTQSLDQIMDPLLSLVDFAKLEALERSPKPLDFNDSSSSEELGLSQESPSLGIGNEDADVDEKESEMQFDAGEVLKPKTKRVLEFDDEVMDDVGLDGKMNDSDVRKGGEEDLSEERVDGEKKKKKKRAKKDGGDESKAKPQVNKRREEKVAVNVFLCFCILL